MIFQNPLSKFSLTVSYCLLVFKKKKSLEYEWAEKTGEVIFLVVFMCVCVITLSVKMIA